LDSHIKKEEQKQQQLKKDEYLQYIKDKKEEANLEINKDLTPINPINIYQTEEPEPKTKIKIKKEKTEKQMEAFKKLQFFSYVFT
jgi:hypothetical protein